MNWFKKFMTGRYGVDQLSFGLLILTLLITFLGSLLRLPLLAFAGYLPIGLVLFRMLSKNISKRSMENYKFNMLISPAYSWILKKRRRLADQKTHKFMKCSKCNAELRLPKGKGKIIVTCPKCKSEFTAKT